MFADTDFILALLKESDWLKSRADQILEENRGKIKTSISVVIEVALMCKKFKLNTLNIFTQMFEFIEVDEETYSASLQASFYIEKYGLNVFDAFNAAFCGIDKIISSDSVYGPIGLERIKLEK